MESWVHEHVEKMIDFLQVNVAAISAMVTGVVLGKSDIHHNFSDVITDPISVGLIKDYIGILCTLGGFSLMIYNTFFRKAKDK